jgi:hypothetical protein
MSSSNDYMEKALLPRDNWEEKSMKRIIRNKFKEVFPKRNCFTLVRPVNDEKLLRNIEDIEYEDLRKEFRVELSKFLSFIQMKSEVKKVQGKSLNGKTFCLFVRHIVDCLNSDSFPGISTVNERLSKYQRKQVVKRAISAFNERREPLVQELPMSETVLGERLEEVRLEVMTGMQTEWIQGEEWILAVKEWKSKIKPMEIDIFEENMEKSREINAGLVTEVIERFRKSMQEISKELEVIEPRIEDLGGSSGNDDDLNNILEQSRQSIINISRMKKKMTRTMSIREKMVRLVMARLIV